ncbi:hypothetical protein OSB04_001118 [Centaurea solstitialis]|uniref:Integrase catalytic domain-containing protein n=1 Tax=Centaurea solstitialis TaxID=347529 RepID=A0AA38U8P4_9ASTR|nr:hypothetical protein OSB04_001118 [Centaurea solstitialis]
MNPIPPVRHVYSRRPAATSTPLAPNPISWAPPSVPRSVRNTQPSRPSREEVRLLTLLSNDTAFLRFNIYFDKHAHSPKGFLEDTVSRIPSIQKVIKLHGWNILCAVPEPYNLSWVREFYTEASIRDSTRIPVRGILVDYSPASIHALLNTRPHINSTLDALRKHLSKDTLHDILSTLTIPGSDWYFEGYLFDVGVLISANIKASCTRKNGQLLYPTIIHGLMAKVNVWIFPTDIFPKEHMVLGRKILGKLLRSCKSRAGSPHVEPLPKSCTHTPTDHAQTEQFLDNSNLKMQDTRELYRMHHNHQRTLSWISRVLFEFRAYDVHRDRVWRDTVRTINRDLLFGLPAYPTLPPLDPLITPPTRRQTKKGRVNLRATIKTMEVDRREYRIKWEKKEFEKKLVKSGEELESVKKELEKAKEDLDKFSKSSKVLEEILKAQVHDELKRGIGYHNTPPPRNHTYIPPTTDILDRLNREELKEGVCDIDPSSSDDEEEQKGKTENKSQETVSEENHILTNEKGGMPFVPSKNTTASRKGKEKLVDQEPATSQPAKRSKHTHRNDSDPGTSKQPQTSAKPRGNKRNWNNQWAQTHGVDLNKINKPKPCFICCNLNHLAKDCYYNPFNQRMTFQNQRVNFQNQKQFQTRRTDYNSGWSVPKPVVKKQMVQKRKGQPKKKVNAQMKKVEKKTVKMVTKWVPKASLSNTIASTRSGNESVASESSGNNQKDIEVNTAASNSSSGISNTVATTSFSLRQPIVTKYSSHKIPNKDYLLKLNRLTEGNPNRNENLWHVDSGCSRHMTGNRSFLEDFTRFNGGYVAFGDNPRGGKVSGKGKVTGGKLTLEEVYYVDQLRYNLMSVSQVCDKKFFTLFSETECMILSPKFVVDESLILLRTPRKDNVYCLDLNGMPSEVVNCLFSKASMTESSLWHRRMGHMNIKTMNLLVKNQLVRGLPSKEFTLDDNCVACLKGKQHKASHKSKTINTISAPLQLLHMDLFGPTNVMSIGKKSYCLVIIDDYSRFTWVFFLRTKDETSGLIKPFVKRVENQVNLRVKVIRSNNGTEFKNVDLNSFCEEKGIERQFSAPRTPQQNGVAERRNRTLIEAARTMLADSKLPITFWAEAVNTACYVQNRVHVVKSKGKTPYELFKNKKPFVTTQNP